MWPKGRYVEYLLHKKGSRKCIVVIIHHHLNIPSDGQFHIGPRLSAARVCRRKTWAGRGRARAPPPLPPLRECVVNRPHPLPALKAGRGAAQ